ncbi:MAG: hypothetical protein ACT4NV_04625 [Rhodoferax sp.]
MSNKNLAAVTNELIETYGNTAKNVIAAYRVGNERAISYVDQRWASAVKKAGKRLSADVAGNAIAAQKKVTSLYAQGVEITSESAEIAVNKTVELAGKGVEQVAANASRFEKATGLTTLSKVAEVAVPAAEAATKVASKLEERTSELANKIAGKQAKVKVAVVKKPAAKKTVVKKAAAPKKAAKADVAAEQASA